MIKEVPITELIMRGSAHGSGDSYGEVAFFLVLLVVLHFAHLLLIVCHKQMQMLVLMAIAMVMALALAMAIAY